MRGGARRPAASATNPQHATQKAIRTTVVRSLEPIDLDEWLDRYARAIVEAESRSRATAPSAPLDDPAT